MSIPISIEKLLEENVIEWARIEFKEGWNPDSTLKTISAFANDIDNWGGGYIIIGVKEKNGKLVKPIKGINEEKIDGIQKEVLQYCKYLKPSYIPQIEPVYYEGKTVLLIWCPGGYDRPYQCPKKPSLKKSERIYYIRKLSSTIEATDMDVKELMTLSHNIPYDDRINMKAEISDLKYPLLVNYLEEVRSNLLGSLKVKTVYELANDLRIADGPKEYFKPLNVGLLFFHDMPEKFFPYCRIEVVIIPDPTGQGMEERIFSGPINQQLKDVLKFIKNNIIAEKIYKVDNQAESIRIKNYSYEALEEFISNAVYHKSYQIHEPITIRIEKNLIEITSIPGPDRSIQDEDIKKYNMRTRRYRNRRIGDFLKELHLVEGRNTGIPTAIKSIKENGSPLPKLLTDSDRSFFSVILPIHDMFIEKVNVEKSRTRKIRRTKEEIKKLILEILEENDLSASEIYKRMGYTGGISKTFRICINELIDESKICYHNKNKNAPNNLITKR